MIQKIEKVFLHWSGTPYNWRGYDSKGKPDYHHLFNDKGETVLKVDYHEFLTGHTYCRNSNAVAFSCACMGKGPNGEPEGFEGLYPPTKVQIDAMCLAVAKLVYAQGWHVNMKDPRNLEDRILTHAEAAALRDYPLETVLKCPYDDDAAARALGLPHANYGPRNWRGAPVDKNWPGGSVERWDWWMVKKDGLEGSGGYVLRERIGNMVLDLRNKEKR